ncbi:MAG: ferrous iron transport protein A [Bryobacterales bacterium]|jgi:ferrous iron transport protein A|nr:ferrous iron transport protein A [Bryobacterales bacterium]
MLLQPSFNKRRRRRHRGGRGAEPLHLGDLHRGEQGILDHIDLPPEAARRLMELGFVPGTLVTAAGCAPGGDPRVFRVDGTEVAVRRETAVHLKLRHPAAPVP